MEPKTYSSLSMRFGILDLHLPLKIGSGLLNCIHLKNVLIYVMCASLSLQEKGNAKAGTYGGMRTLCLNTGIDQACPTAVCIKQAERKERRLSRSAMLRQEMSGFAAVADEEQVVSH